MLFGQVWWAWLIGGETASSVPMQPGQTRYEAPVQISESSRSAAELQINNTDPIQDREQDAHSHGQEDG